jgi:hypothetical protein
MSSILGLPKLSRRALLLSLPGAGLLAQEEPQDQWDKVARIVAVGDVHGDCDAFVSTLQMAGLVDSNADWSGGSAHLVQIGDIPSRGSQARQAFDLMMKLEKQAAAAGGRAHALIGNHEVMPMYGDMRNLTPEEYAEFATPDSEALRDEAWKKELASRPPSAAGATAEADLEAYRQRWLQEHPLGFVELRRAFAPDGAYGSWIRSHNTVLRINETLFVHGGISPAILPLSISKINRTMRAELLNPSMFEGLAPQVDGPLWYRDLAEEDERKLTPHLNAVLRAFRVRRLVIGHTVTRSAILPRFGSRVVNIDLGLSRFYKRPPACLVIDEQGTRVLHAGTNIALPGPDPGQRLQYLRAVAEADPEPAVIQKVIDGLPTTVR